MSKTKILLVVLIGLALPLYILWKTISVSFLYSSLGEPLSGIKITLQEVDGKNLIVFPEKENYFFNRAKLALIFENNDYSGKNFEVKAYQNFLAALYPINDEILNAQKIKEFLFSGNTTDLPAGSLFINGDSVDVMLPNNTYRTFFDAELFQKMGYHWEDLVDKPVGFAANLTEGPIFNYGNAHPSGTFLKNDEKVFLVWEKELFEIEDGLDVKEFTKTSPIKVNSIDSKPFGECSTQVKKNQLICSFTKDFNEKKSDYIFEVEDFKNENLKEITLKLSSSFSSWSLINNLEVSLEDFKLNLIKKYRGYIPFI